MTDRILPIFAYAIFLVFVGILAWHVPSPDLVVVIAVTALLTGYDLFLHSRRSGRR